MSDETFRMEIDHDRHLVMKVLHGMSLKYHGPDIATALKKEGLAGAALSYLEEFSDKIHELGWCDDPKCTHGKEE